MQRISLTKTWTVSTSGTNSVDLIIEHNKIKQAYKKSNTTQNNATRETSSEDEVDHDDKSHEGLKNSTPIGNLKNDNDEERETSGEASEGEEYRTSTLERIRRQRLRDSSNDGPFDIASMARLSYAKKKNEQEQLRKQCSEDDTENDNKYDDDSGSN